MDNQKLQLKSKLLLALLIIVTNTQGIFYVNYYFPGTILLTMAMLTYFFKNNLKAKEITLWLLIPTLIFWLFEIFLSATGLGGAFITLQFFSILSLIVLGTLTKRATVPKNWKTIATLLVVWFIDIIWTAVAYKQGMNTATRIYQGGSPEDELNFVNRFFLGVVYAIEICSILTLVEFTQVKKEPREN